MIKQQLNIGLFGFGCVGQGLWEVLHHTRGIKAAIAKICVKDRSKQRSIDAGYFTYNKRDILDDESIDIVVELIDDADEAYSIVREALQKGKSVVTANKKMLAQHIEELFSLQQQHGVSLLYEAAVGGSIPIIRSLEEYYDNDLLSSVEGVVNGTTNYILTKMFEDGAAYPEALAEAQVLGFAESNPYLDVSAKDAQYKTALLLLHSFGLFVNPENIVHYGIQHAGQVDFAFALNKECTLKLVAQLRRVGNQLHAYVAPAFIRDTSPLASVRNEFNGISLEAAFSDTQFYLGRGAGSLPTAGAVLSDISALTYGYRYEYKKYYQEAKPSYTNDTEVDVYVRFADERDIKLLNFCEVYEYHLHREWADVGESANIIIGRIKLCSLLQREVRENPHLFVVIANALYGIRHSTESDSSLDELPYIADRKAVCLY